jgi:outer membrane protein assembly factor BamB
LVVVATLIVAGTTTAFAAEVTGQADNLRTGWYPAEPSLAPGQITKERFKLAFEGKLEGQIYAQPLVANGTLLVVTEENWAYGLDPVTGAVRWKEQYGTAVTAGEGGATIKCTDLEPRVGITGTPVIDTEHNVAYFVANRYVEGEAGAIGWYMNAIDLSTGQEKPKFPVKIEGEPNNLAKIEKFKFDPLQQLQRPALLMMNGVVYTAFGSHCDTKPYEGWIVGVSSTGEVVTKWATSFFKHGAAIWQSGSGLMSDGPGQMLFTTGNGFEAGEADAPVGTGKQKPPPEGKLGESVVRAEVLPGGELETTDYFSPFNSKELDEKDADIGSAGPVALPSPYFGTKPLLVQEGKAPETVYLLDRGALGGHNASKNEIVQEITAGIKGLGGLWGSAAVWPGDGGYVEIPSAGHLFFFSFHEEAGKPALAPVAKTGPSLFFGSGSPIVTSNGAANGTGVLWVTRCPKGGCTGEQGELQAYNAASNGLTVEPMWTAKVGIASKFSRPVASNGHVYVGNREGHVLAFSGPAMTTSTESLELAAPVGGQANGKVTFTNTGSENEVLELKPAGGPFEAALPKPSTKLEPGQQIKVAVAFKPSARGSFAGTFSVVTKAGEIKVALSGLGEQNTQEKEQEQREREAREREAREREARERAEREAKERATATTVSLLTPIEPVLSLTNLKVRAKASRLSSHRRKLAVSYSLSAAGKVKVVIYRRTTSHNCRKGVSTCTRWIATKLKLVVTGHGGTNLLTVSLGPLRAGDYRLDATPLNGSGAAGVTRTVQFRMSH